MVLFSFPTRDHATFILCVAAATSTVLAARVAGSHHVSKLKDDHRPRQLYAPEVDPLNEQHCQAECIPVHYELSNDLPNVLIFGDSVASTEMGYFSKLQEQLAGKAKLHFGLYRHPTPNGDDVCGTSLGALACADTWLGEGSWDVISFNWGLHDVCPQKYVPVPVETYAHAMLQMYQVMLTKIKSHGKIVFQTTTPVSADNRAGRKNEDVLNLNARLHQMWSQINPAPVVNDVYTSMVAACRTVLARRGGEEARPNVLLLKARRESATLADAEAAQEGALMISMARAASCYPGSCVCPLQMEGDVHWTDDGNSILASLVATSIERLL